MRVAACLLVLALTMVLLSGCPLLPTREASWCLPKAKVNRDRHEIYAGVRCAW